MLCSVMLIWLFVFVVTNNSKTLPAESTGNKTFPRREIVSLIKSKTTKQTNKQERKQTNKQTKKEREIKKKKREK